MAEEVEVVRPETERLADGLDFFDEARQIPEIRLVGLVAVEGPELIVVVVLDLRGREEAVESLDDIKDLGAGAGPAVSTTPIEPKIDEHGRAYLGVELQ